MGKIFKTFLVALPVVCILAYFYGGRALKLINIGKSDKNSHVHSSYSIQNALKEENVVSVAIIGSGPAGLSAALYVARAGMKAFVFAGPMPCGQLTQTTYIENWPGSEKIMGPELMNDMKKQVVSFGATIIHDTVTNIDFSKWPFSLKTEEGRSFKAMSIILATGATPKTLGIPGEQEFFGKGVTTCAVCDAFFFKNKEVVIAGGGDSAAEMVFELAPYVKKVTMLVRKGSMKAAAAIQKRVFECPNAVVEYHKDLVAIYGSAKECQTHEENTCGCNSSEVCAIDVYDNETKKTERRPIDGVFLSIGHDPNNKLIKGSIDLDEHGCMVMQGRTQQSSIPGVFAAGEIQDPLYRQAIVAAGEGAKAALDAISFLYEIGFTVAIGQKLDQKFNERFSDQKVELERIDQYEELEAVFAKHKGLVLLDFYSDNCPGCIRMLPVLESIAYELGDKIKIVKTNHDDVVDQNCEKHKGSIFRYLWNHYDPAVKVRRLPSLLVFKDGKYMGMNIKIMSKNQLLEYLQPFLS